MRVGICGRPGSGKTTLANALGLILSWRVLSQDSYFTETKVRTRGFVNYEVKSAYDFSKLFSDMIKPKASVIVEGFLLYTDLYLVDSLDLRILLEVSDKTLLERQAVKEKPGNSREYIEKIVIPESKLSKPIASFKPHVIFNSDLLSPSIISEATLSIITDLEK